MVALNSKPRTSRRLLESVPLLLLMSAVVAMLVGYVPHGSSLASAAGAWSPTQSQSSVTTLAEARASLGQGHGPSAPLTHGLSQPPSSVFPTTGSRGTPWTNVYNVSQPSARATPAMAYSPIGHYVLYFGGGANLGSSGSDTWMFANGVWTNITASLSVSPIGREDAMMTYDAADGYIVLFGGYTDLTALGNVVLSYTLNDTWAFQSGAWTNLSSLSPAAPPALFSQSMTYDYTDGYVVLFGGSVLNGGPVNETWTFSAGIWTDITSTAGTAPSPRNFASLTDDPNDGYLVLFGGWDSSTYTIFNDTWTFSGGKWSQLSAPVAPPLLRGTMTAYDPATKYVILFGGATWGYSGPFSMLSETWTFSAGSWTNLTAFMANAPPARDLAGFTNFSTTASNSSSSAAILMADGCLGQGCASSLDLSDTWIYDTSGPYGRPWVEVGGTIAPSARNTPGMAYDPIAGYVVYFGGGWSTGGAPHDTWTFAHGVWTNLSANLSIAPGGREGVLMTWDASDGYVVLFGGYTDGGSGGAYSYTLNDTWKFQGSNWTNITALSPHAPPPRFVSEMTYDYTDGYVVLFGGNTLFGGPLSDTWTFHAGVWTQVATGAAPHPTGRDFVSLTDDPAAGYLVLFGGWNSSTASIYNDTWAFAHGNWTKLATPVAPLPLRGAMVAYEAVGQYVLLFGGTTYSSPGWPFGLESQTWAFKSGNWTNLTPFITTAPSARFSGAMTNISDSGAILMADGCLGQGCPQPQDLSDSWIYNWSNINGTVTLRAQPHAPHQPANILVNAVGGDFAYRYRYTGLPSGCVTADTANFSCTPQVGGNFSVVVVVSDAAGQSMHVPVNLSSPVAVPLTVSLALSTPELDVGQTVELTSTASGGTGAPWSYSYSGLPKGCQSQSVAQLSCTPSESGSFVVVATAKDSQGGSVTSSASFIVHASVRVAAAISAAVIDLTQRISISAAASFGSSIYSYAWSGLPTGCSATSTTTNVNCVPSAAGTSTIAIRATDSLGQSSTSSPMQVTVNALPTVVASASATTTAAPLTVTFVAHPGGGTGPFTVAWVFGDGQSDFGLSVTHTFLHGGTYTPRVWFNDTFGFGANSVLVVTVTEVTTVIPPVVSHHSGTPSWFETSAGQLSLGILAGLFAFVVVGTWATERRRELRNGQRLVEAVESTPFSGSAKPADSEEPSGGR